MGAERLSTQIDDDATIEEKAIEIYQIALDLGDALDAIDLATKASAPYSVFKRIVWTIECLASEIACTAEGDRLALAKTAQPAAVVHDGVIGSATSKRKAKR
jgi:hypothetical protein